MSIMPDDQSKSPRYVFAAFCDDIRFEVGGKITLVGMYGADMYLPEFPYFIPKLGVSTIINSPIGQVPKSLSIKIEKGDEVLMEFELGTAEQIKAAISQSPSRSDMHDLPTRSTYFSHIITPPITIAQPCTLRAIAVVDGEAYMAGKLHIGKMPEPS